MRACPSCGAENPDRARFCLECGSGLAAEEPVRHEVRKTVTVLFTDLTGFTALAERLDPEALRRIMGSAFAAIRGAIERHGGTVEKYIGDAVMAVFGIPVAHEDDALRAVRAASELETALAPLNAEFGAVHGQAIRVRTGVNTGEVVVGVPGSETLVTGDPVNVAARLQQIAEPGEVILGQATSWLVRDAVRIEPLDPLVLKGKSGPVAACRLVEVRPGAEGRARRPDAPMVGRDREMAAIRHAFERAVTDRTVQLFTVFGTAGVGKSRLVREFLAAVVPVATVLRGRCLPYGDGITYWPIIEVSRAAAGIEESDPAVVARGKLDGLLEDVADGTLIAERVAQVVGLAPGVAPQEEIFWSIRRLLTRLAATRPLVLVIDDIHWAEPTLLDLLEHVVDLSRDVPLLVLVSARPELLEARPGWGGGRLNATAILLEPLPDEAAAALVEGLLGAGIPASVRDRVTAAAEGNPLYVEELIGILLDDGVLRPSADGTWETVRDVATVPIPPTIQALLAARLDRLESVERAVAERASVVGRVFERAAVRHLSPEPQRPAVDGRLTALVRKDLIRPDPAAADEDIYRFRHILIRDAAYDSLPKTDRADLHERFADWLEAGAGDRLAEVEEIIGHHLEQAIRYRAELGLGGDRSLVGRAAARLGSAARRAADRSDHRAAASLLARTADILPADDPGGDWLLVDLASERTLTGEPAAAHAALDKALERAAANGDERLAAMVRVQRWLVASAYRGSEEAIRDADAALALLEGTSNHREMARAWELKATTQWSLGRGQEAEASARQSLEHARAAGARIREVGAYDVLSAIFPTGPTPVEEGIRRCEEILAREAGNRAIEAWMWHALSHLRVRKGEFDAARGLIARSRAVLEETGQPLAYAMLSEAVADVEIVAGNPAAAVRTLEDGLAASARLAEPDAMLSTFLARAAWEAGDLELAERSAEHGRSGSSWIRAIAEAYLGRVRAARGRLDEAESLARAGVAFMEGTDLLNFRAWTWECLGDVLAAAGRPSEAIAALDAAIALHERKGSVVPAEHARRRRAQILAEEGVR